MVESRLKRAAVAALMLAAASLAIAEQQAPPESGFRNVQVLAGVSPEEMGRIMEAANQSLGVECDYCHQEGEWHLDDRQSKRTAREMIRMLAELSVTDFEVLELPSCWTCHRGSTTPERQPAQPAAIDLDGQNASSAFVQEPGPAGQVYENLEQYGDLPTGELRQVMESYSRALGVDCAHCHVEGDWADDQKVTKIVARRMLEIQDRIASDFFDSREVISCWTCHRGEATPSVALPADPAD